MAERKIYLDVEKFKEMLIYSWHLLSLEKQQELIEMGIYPRKIII